jgi:hypothetical protein
VRAILDAWTGAGDGGADGDARATARMVREGMKKLPAVEQARLKQRLAARAPAHVASRAPAQATHAAPAARRTSTKPRKGWRRARVEVR